MNGQQKQVLNEEKLKSKGRKYNSRKIDGGTSFRKIIAVGVQSHILVV